MSTALTIRPEAAAVAARIDDISASGMELLRQSGFTAELTLAKAIGDMRVALTAEVMKPVMDLMNTDLGFRCDRPSKQIAAPYSLEVVRDVLIEAKLRGFRAVGNEFNIISGRFYAAKNGLRRKVTTWPGISEFRENYGVPRGVAGGAIVPCKATWKLDGADDVIDCEIPVRVNDNMGADAILGKAARKLYARIHDRLAGFGTPEGDVEDDFSPPQTITPPPVPPPAPPKPATQTSGPPAPPPPPKRPDGPGPAVQAREGKAEPGTKTRAPATTPAGDAGPDPRPYSGPGSEIFGQGDAPAEAPKAEPAPAPSGEAPPPVGPLPPADPGQPTVDTDGVVLVDTYAAQFSMLTTLGEWRALYALCSSLRDGEKNWLGWHAATALVRLTIEGPVDELDALMAVIGKWRARIAPEALEWVQAICVARRAAP